MLALAGWALFAIGGVPLWSLAPIVAAAAALAWTTRASRPADRVDRVLDIALVTILGVLAFQLVPLPRAVLESISPYSNELDSALTVSPGAAGARSIAFDPRATGIALLLVASAIAVFRAARGTASDRSFALAGGIAAIGLTAAFLAIVQRAMSPDLMYGLWKPAEPHAHPFGPFVNRNHFATWLLMALPLTIGALLGRIALAAGGGTRARSFVARLVTPDVVWFALASAVMTLALVMSTSRASLAAFGAAVCIAAWLARSRGVGRGRLLFLLAGLLVLLPVAAFADFGGVLARIRETAAAGETGRLAIWHDTLRVIQRFWMSGTGAGTYGTAMLVYQHADRTVFFNQAHNHYLQLAAEGGALLAVPVAVAAAALAVTIRRRLATDALPAFWIRLGATSSLVAVAVQSLWETGLRMPANAVLFAIVAAVAAAPMRGGRGGGSSGTRRA